MKHYATLRIYEGTPYATELVMAEVEVLEIISKKAHPNILGAFVMGIPLQVSACRNMTAL